MSADELPATVTGIARRRHAELRPGDASSGPDEVLRDPIPYEGYPLGPLVFAWGTQMVDGKSALLMVTEGDLVLTLTPADSTERARTDAAALWRRFAQLSKEPHEPR